ncbi:MAG TPA: hypothetical protein VNO32_48090 [Candidatus Acidoferrum sp.]|nr:hypothetical protein [Candidatus Acidoferrum sp.]
MKWKWYASPALDTTNLPPSKVQPPDSVGQLRSIGVVTSLAVMRLMSSLLFDIQATDLLTFVAVAALLSLVALFASYVPARRAMKVDPMIALRYE